MKPAKTIDYFRDALEPYIEFNEEFNLISASNKSGKTYHVYLTDIKREFLTLAPDHSSIILKELSSQQAAIYRKICSLWNPHLETVYGILEQDGHFLSFNEFIQAPQCLDYNYRSISLADYIQHYGCFTEQEALLLLYQLCDGVEALQKINLTHGDISPQNILLTDAAPPNELLSKFARKNHIIYSFFAKIIDFDIAKEKKESDHQVTTIIGTSSFAAPEILDYRYPSDKVDIYSLGCILHYMITGKSPKDTDTKISEKQMQRRTYRIIKHCTAAYDIRYKNITKLKQNVLHEIKHPTNTFLNKIPGFRTRRIWKMIVAVYGYGTYFFALLLHFVYDYSFDKEDILLNICFIVEVILVCDVFHLGKLSASYTYISTKYPIIRYLVKFLILIIVFIFYSALL